MNPQALTRACVLAGVVAVGAAACGSRNPSSAARALFSHRGAPTVSPARAEGGPRAPLGNSERSGNGSAASAARPLDARDLVTAVSAAHGGGLVAVRFALRDRPEVGHPAELDLEVTPLQPLTRLIASFRAAPGLVLVSGGGVAQRARPDAGVPIPYTLTVLAREDGVFYVDATVLADSGSESVSRTFTIPIIAGAGEH